jgi:uncharacterized membrane protein (DUF106 family)
MILLSLSPILVVFLVGAAISITMSLVNKKLMSTEAAKRVKERMQEVRERMLEAQKAGNANKMNECLRELMKINSEYMRFMFKPMIVSVVLVLLILPLLSKAYSGQTVATIPETFPVVGGAELSWFWWYFICTLVVSVIAKRILGA